MNNKLITIFALICTSLGYFMRENNQIISNQTDNIIEVEEITDPLIVYSNFTKDIYTKDRKIYCVFYNNTSIVDRNISHIRFTYPYILKRDKVKGTSCIKMDLFHPFIIHDKESFLSLEYEYKKKIFIYKITFTIHENNILCLILTIIYNSIIQPVILMVFLFIRLSQSKLDEFEYSSSSTFFSLLFILIDMCIISAIIVACMSFVVYPYSIISVGIIIGFEYVLLTAKSYVIKKGNRIMKKKKIYLDASYSIKDISIACSILCCIAFVVALLFASKIRIDKILSNRFMLLALEYHSVIVVSYTCIFVVSILIFAIFY